MKQAFLSLILAALAAFSASAGVITEKVNAIAKIDGVSFIGNISELNCEKAQIYIIPANKVDDVKNLLLSLPEDDTLNFDINNDSEEVTIWSETVGESNVDSVVLVNKDNQCLVLYANVDNADNIKNFINTVNE